MTIAWERRINKAFSQMLRFATNLPRSTPLLELYQYGQIPFMTSTLTKRRLDLAGHALRRPQPFCSIFLWNPRIGQPYLKGRQGSLLHRLINDMDLEDPVFFHLAAQGRREWRIWTRKIAYKHEEALHETIRQQRLIAATDPQRVINHAHQVILEQMLAAMDRSDDPQYAHVHVHVQPSFYSTEVPPIRVNKFSSKSEAPRFNVKKRL